MHNIIVCQRELMVKKSRWRCKMRILPVLTHFEECFWCLFISQIPSSEHKSFAELSLFLFTTLWLRRPTSTEAYANLTFQRAHLVGIRRERNKKKLVESQLGWTIEKVENRYHHRENSTGKLHTMVLELYVKFRINSEGMKSKKQQSSRGMRKVNFSMPSCIEAFIRAHASHWENLSLKC